MLTLVAGGIERNYAYELSERIRKGKGLTENQFDELLKKGFEKWKLDSWNKTSYTFPRAPTASYTLYAYQMAYYKVYYPLEFYCAYFNTYLDQFDADLLINNSSVLHQRIYETKIEKNGVDIPNFIMMEVCQEMYDKGFEFSTHNVKHKIKEFIISNDKICPISENSDEDNTVYR